MAANWITLADAKEHLDITHALRDAFIQTKLEEATAIVERFLNFDLPDEPWTAATLPGDIRAAVLLVTAALYANRGTDDQPDPQRGPVLSYRVQSLLAPWHVSIVG